MAKIINEENLNVVAGELIKILANHNIQFKETEKVFETVRTIIGEQVIQNMSR